MRRIANAEMRNAFLGWQCRIRQMAMREYGGQPLPGMRPRVSTRSGGSLSPGLVVLLLPLEPRESTAFFKYQVQKTNEPQKTRDAGIGYLAPSSTNSQNSSRTPWRRYSSPIPNWLSRSSRRAMCCWISSSSVRLFGCSAQSAVLEKRTSCGRRPCGRRGFSPRYRQ